MAYRSTRDSTNIIKNIGIWGYGTVGKSAVEFFKKNGSHITLIDKALSPEDRHALNENNIVCFNENDLEQFFETNEYILASPGIDLRNYKKYHPKLITEIDLFTAHFKKPIIAITGTVGKTTLATLLAQLLSNNGLRVAAAGNIGTPMLNLIEQQDSLDYAILELSSFQLEFAQQFAPDIAIWTNFYPNHLDRHSTITDYFAAKLNMLKHQTAQQNAILSSVLKVEVSAMLPNIQQEIIIPKKDIAIPNVLPETAGALKAVSDLLQLDLSMLKTEPLEHRIELVATYNDITFYNDSKATVRQATLAAVDQLKSQPIILLLGGLDKGVDRTPLIAQLKNKVKKIICFGAQANTLQKACKQYGIDSTSQSNLDDAFTSAIDSASPHDIVLLSPSGASFDLFKNYQERGNYFKQLVHEHRKSCA